MINQIFYKNVEINILRTDILHPQIQGNKYYKLKYNIEFAKANKMTHLLSFGGNYSNHLHALSIAGNIHNMKTIGIVRGDEISTRTIDFCKKNGMQIHFINRSDYREIRPFVNSKNKKQITKIFDKNNIILPPKTYIIPEGGTNNLAIKGTEEILKNTKLDFDKVFCPIGTGGTISGIINYLKGDKKVVGIASFKENFLHKDIEKMIFSYSNKIYFNWQINRDYHFGGFAKSDTKLDNFTKHFTEKYKIPVCHVYTGKMMFGIFDMIDSGQIQKNEKILVIHTGGTQGIK